MDRGSLQNACRCPVFWPVQMQWPKYSIPTFNFVLCKTAPRASTAQDPMDMATWRMHVILETMRKDVFLSRRHLISSNLQSSGDADPASLR